MADVVVDAKPKPQLPFDPDVIPEAVRQRAAKVDAFYNGQNGAAPNPDTAAPTEPPDPSPAPAPQASTNLPPASTPAAVSAELEDENSGSWKQRYARMQGRYNASQKQLGEMQEQMTQLGNELLFAQNQARKAAPVQQPEPLPSYLTEQDVQNYGDELVDFAQRAAVHAVAPHLRHIQAENADLRGELAQERRRRLDQQVEIGVPNYREIDQDPRWHRWLLGIDVLSGRVRQQLLDEAIATAQAPRVISFFRGFLNEEAATGHIEPASRSHQAAPPREAAIPLASLAAPGRARPATGGDSSMPPDRPIYTRAQIRQIYEQHRRGAYVGREAEWARQDADIIAAGREGRIR